MPDPKTTDTAPDAGKVQVLVTRPQRELLKEIRRRLRASGVFRVPDDHDGIDQ